MKGDCQLIHLYPKKGVNLLQMQVIFEYVLGVIQFLSNVEHYSHGECADEKKMNWDDEDLYRYLDTNIDDAILLVAIVFEYLCDKRRAILYEDWCWNTDILWLPASD